MNMSENGEPCPVRPPYLACQDSRLLQQYRSPPSQPLRPPARVAIPENADMIATMNDTILSTRIASPIGTLTLTSNGTALTRVSIADADDVGDTDVPAEADAILAAVREQLDAYFDMRLMQFDLPLEPRGTGFQRRVWESLRVIPFGETISYAELARRVDNPKAVRAVGAANGRNPLMIVVPCHRVIGADGSLTGFGGGIERKRWLLDHETRVRLR
jgi:methylated-DNA-[protein]-cysteine S-methyltransferase